MIRNLMAFKDKKLGVYSKLIETNLKPEDYAEEVRRSCASPEVPSSFFDNDIYHVGVYDDKIGLITPVAAVFIASCDDFRYLREKKDVN